MARVSPKKNRVREKYRLGISAIRYVPVPDAEARLLRAVDVLLRVATQSHSPPDKTGNAPKSSHPDEGDSEVKPDGG